MALFLIKNGGRLPAQYVNLGVYQRFHGHFQAIAGYQRTFSISGIIFTQAIRYGKGRQEMAGGYPSEYNEDD